MVRKVRMYRLQKYSLTKLNKRTKDIQRDIAKILPKFKNASGKEETKLRNRILELNKEYTKTLKTILRKGGTF